MFTIYVSKPHADMQSPSLNDGILNPTPSIRGPFTALYRKHRTRPHMTAHDRTLPHFTAHRTSPHFTALYSTLPHTTHHRTSPHLTADRTSPQTAQNPAPRAICKPWSQSHTCTYSCMCEGLGAHKCWSVARTCMWSVALDFTAHRTLPRVTVLDHT